MAQTKRKRRTKHRGNAAGTVEVRGRTGRPPTPDERKKQNREKSRLARLNRAPTWNAAVKRAMLAAAFMFIFLLFTNKSKGAGKIVGALVFALVAMVLYIGLGYYIEMYLWRRRMAKKQAAAARR